MRLCLAKKDYIRAQILARKISPRAFQKQQGDSKGEIGIEGTAIEEADKVRRGGAWRIGGGQRWQWGKLGWLTACARWQTVCQAGSALKRRCALARELVDLR